MAEILEVMTMVHNATTAATPPWSFSMSRKKGGSLSLMVSKLTSTLNDSERGKGVGSDVKQQNTIRISEAQKGTVVDILRRFGLQSAWG
jgi:hypothetical protein